MMHFDRNLANAAREGRLWVRCRTLSDKAGAGVKSGFVEEFSISYGEQLAIMRFKGEDALTMVPISGLYVKIKD